MLKKLVGLIAVIGIAFAEVPKTEFYGSLMKPPVYMLGEFYTETDAEFNKRLYVVPTVYIESRSQYAPVDGSYVFMFAQFQAPDVNFWQRGSNATDANAAQKSSWYESWSCSMRYSKDLAQANA